MNSCCIYTGVCGVECSGKDTEVDINSCKVAREIDKLIDRIQKLKREKEKYYQMTLDDEIQIDELFRENAKLKKENEDIKNYAKTTIDNLLKTQTGLINLIDKYKQALEEIKEVFKKYDSEEERTVAELLHDVFEVYGRVCEVLKDENN